MATSTTINVDDLLNALEPLIRRVVREELQRVVTKTSPPTFNLDPDSPLYADLEDILERRATGQIKHYTHQDVWDE